MLGWVVCSTNELFMNMNFRQARRGDSPRLHSAVGHWVFSLSKPLTTVYKACPTLCNM